MNRQAQGMLLFFVGGAVLRASLTDLYLRYVKAGLRPLLIAAGVVLIAAALTTLWYDVRSRRRARVAAGGHAHGHREPWIAWMLVLPVFALIAVIPPALGSYAAQRAGTNLQKPLGYADLPAGDPLRLRVLDYATRAVFDHGRFLATRRIQLTGFVTIGPGGAPYLTRLVVSCCAADALPVEVGLSGRVPPGLPPDAWLEVTGSYTARQAKDSYNGQPIPFLDVDTTRPIGPPADPYES